jgi:hypothetical protein
MKLLLLLLSALASFAQSPSPFPPATTRARMLEALAAKMEKLDGEALFVRERGRKKTFASVAAQLKEEARRAQSWPELYQVFSRLDHAYSSLHASFRPTDLWPRERKQLKARFGTDWLSPEKTGFRIRAVDEDFPAPKPIRPEPGDLLLAINGRSMEDWSREHFEFCKWPLWQQCDQELPEYFSQEGVFLLERGGRRWEVKVPVEKSQAGEAGDKRCGKDKNLYQGFTLRHAGRFACLFEKDGDPSTVLLRISSFYYETGYEGGDEKIRSVRDEVDAFWPWWKDRAPHTQHLIIDVADNTGGNTPIPYYEVLLPKPYQEQWVRFRKMPELLDEKLRESLFWGEQGQEIWFQNLQREGVWDQTAWGNFLPPVPMFCPSSEHDCREGLFQVKDHGFRGRVSVITNHWCVSSCDGFVYELYGELGAKIVGQPQAADSAYSRLKIQGFLDGEGFHLKTVPLQAEDPEGLLFSQTVAITRSSTQRGSSISGIPVPVDRFVPSFASQSNEEWRTAAVRAALDSAAR